MVIPNTKSPHWMDQFLTMSIYETNRRCNIHPNKHETILCVVCMGDPICDTCWNNDEFKMKHFGHISLQVCVASHRTSIAIKDINKYWDASEIQRYLINDKQVIYLNPKLNGSVENNRNPKCEICQRKLKSESTYKFCSIACKLARTDCPLVVEKSAPVKPRSKARKGIPRRSPLF